MKKETEVEIEILAPAGSYETMKTAVFAGADAVYAGGSRFGARAYAQNFTEEELLDAIDYVHLHGKKLYLTVNTLLKEREMPDIYDYLAPFYERGLDAVIVQDLGVLSFVQEQFKGMAVHASTQMTVTNVRSAKYLEDIGVERVVPARELSLCEVRQIAEKTNLEVECFVHGALCYCYSGQCLLSSMIGGRSGNRGQCAQPCRLPYLAGEERRPADILSLKDLCTIERIPDFIEAGITSFKIEGRMKQPDYVAAVTKMYRKYTDLYLEKGRAGYRVLNEDKERLFKAYQRRGYCEGYYYQQNGRDMLSLKRPEAAASAETEWTASKIQEKINGKLILSVGKPATLALNYKGTTIEISGADVQAAVKQPVTMERLEKQMKKTGNTPFIFEHLDICMDGDIFIPVQSLNELRRSGMEALEQKLLQPFKRKAAAQATESSAQSHEICKSCEERKGQEECKNQKMPFFTVSVEELSQMDAVLTAPWVERIYVEDSICMDGGSCGQIKDSVRKAREAGKEVYFSMARIFREAAAARYQKHIKDLGQIFDGAMTRNIESFLYLKEEGYEKPVVMDASVYQWNQRAKQFLRGMNPAGVTAPAELNYRELKELGIGDMELVIYGCLPVMISAGCIRKNTKACDHKSSKSVITDRFQKKFIVKNECSYCYNVMYNTAPLVLLDQKTEIEKLRPRSLRLSFTTEDKAAVTHILKEYEDVFVKGKKAKMPKGEFTRGHFKRGVK